jgi:hypothetical protein
MSASVSTSLQMMQLALKVATFIVENLNSKDRVSLFYTRVTLQSNYRSFIGGKI